MQRLIGRLLVTAAPIGLLVAAFLITREPSQVPRPVAALAAPMTYFAIGGAAVLGLAFHRGRTLYSALVVLIAFVAFEHYLAGGTGGFKARTVYAALCILAPAVLMALAGLEERGTTGVHAVLRISLIAGAIAVPAAILYVGNETPIRWAYIKLIDTPLPFKTPIPQIGVLAIVGSLAGTVLLAGKQGREVPLSAVYTIVALTGAVHSMGTELAAAAYLTAAGLILSMAVLTESYRMAFQDELTGLPSRRTLEEALRAVAGTYAIGMVDIDHFKRLNDTYGHDVGDQVLRMVGTKLMDVTGGGRAFRYGGEEFAVLFPGKEMDAAIAHLEQLRATIAGYRIAIRSAQRERRAEPRARRPATEHTEPKTLSVTVSVGVADRSDAHPDAKSVIKAADAALYRAKQEGRNRVCT